MHQNLTFLHDIWNYAHGVVLCIANTKCWRYWHSRMPAVKQKNILKLYVIERCLLFFLSVCVTWIFRDFFGGGGFYGLLLVFWGGRGFFLFCYGLFGLFNFLMKKRVPSFYKQIFKSKKKILIFQSISLCQ